MTPAEKQPDGGRAVGESSEEHPSDVLRGICDTQGYERLIPQGRFGVAAQWPTGLSRFRRRENWSEYGTKVLLGTKNQIHQRQTNPLSGDEPY
ncbi:hypothetical protein CesoFtcFv8_008269 [Champsocephalus esox]|uniref:Uncharacterized protein n=1 Tax=Champsocephalus esox TaxID=159716 RepID=A0AAN8C7P1_9TELE|nr:hypothetical protein CesoFtcFv8_008269 [Champsocephalus esox]